MTIDELREIVSKELGFKVNRLQDRRGKFVKETSELFVSEGIMIGYFGMAKVTGAPVTSVWSLVKRGEDWYFNSESRD